MAGRYRKVDPRIWNDEKFLSLSLYGRHLFLYILTHPSLTFIGAMRATKYGLASELSGGDLGLQEAFAKAFDELLNNGLIVYDEKTSFLFAKNFLKYNLPESANVCIGFGKCLEILPECKLLRYAMAVTTKIIKENQSDKFVKALPIEFKEAFAEAFGEALPEDLGYSNNYITKDKSTKVDKEKNTKKESPKTETEKPRKTRNAPLKKPDDVQNEQTWNDFIRLRNAKHAPLTETALNGIRREAEKAGITLEAALQTCCERGWQGFKADWYRKESYNSYSVNRKSEMPFPSDVSDFTGKPLVEPM